MAMIISRTKQQRQDLSYLSKVPTRWKRADREIMDRKHGKLMLRFCMAIYDSSLGLLLLVECRLEDCLEFGQDSASTLLACLRLQQLQMRL